MEKRGRERGIVLSRIEEGGKDEGPEKLKIRQKREGSDHVIEIAKGP